MWRETRCCAHSLPGNEFGRLEARPRQRDAANSVKGVALAQMDYSDRLLALTILPGLRRTEPTERLDQEKNDATDHDRSGVGPRRYVPKYPPYSASGCWCVPAWMHL